MHSIPPQLVVPCHPWRRVLGGTVNQLGYEKRSVGTNAEDIRFEGI